MKDEKNRILAGKGQTPRSGRQWPTCFHPSSFILHRWSAFLVLGAIVIPGGCSKGPTPPRLVPVSGKLVYQNKPVPLAWLRFYPDAPQGGQGFVADGQSKQDGMFTLQTYPHGPGAVPGRYKVVITLEARGAGIPNRYADPEQTPLRVEIKEEGAPDLLLRLTD